MQIHYTGTYPPFARIQSGWGFALCFLDYFLFICLLLFWFSLIFLSVLQSNTLTVRSKLNIGRVSKLFFTVFLLDTQRKLIRCFSLAWSPWICSVHNRGTTCSLEPRGDCLLCFMHGDFRILLCKRGSLAIQQSLEVFITAVFPA